MKCYFSLTEPDEQNSVYLDLLYVSLKSARQNTDLDLYVIYDGSETGRYYEILKEFNVHIIKQQFSHKQYLKNVYTDEFMQRTFGRVVSIDKVAGSFMRLDIPFIEKEDEYVFYADIDVMFMKNFSHKNFGKPKYLAATSEFDKDVSKMTYFNSGIMYLNVQNMQEISNQIFDMLKKGIPYDSGVVDQGYLNQVCFDKIDIMPVEFNWKPYWGYNKDAYIVHLHAMKPGGNFANSGFGMSEVFLYSTLKDHYQDVDGNVYYMMKYYEFLGKDGKKWISEYISQIFQSVLSHKSQETEYKLVNDIAHLSETNHALLEKINTLTEEMNSVRYETGAINNKFDHTVTESADIKNILATLEEKILLLDNKILREDDLQHKINKLKTRRSYYKMLNFGLLTALLMMAVYIVVKIL